MNKERKRLDRFNSFDLGESSSLKSILFEIQEFFPTSRDFSEIEKLIDECKTAISDEDFPDIKLYREDFIAAARKDMRCLETLRSIRCVMNQTKSSAELVDVMNWDLVMKDGFQLERFHTFIYTMMRLVEADPSDKINRDLGFNAGFTYFTLMKMPGAKRCLIWNSDLVISFFKMFEFIQKQNKNNDQYVDIQILQILEEFKNVFNIVCLSDQEEVLEKYIGTLSYTLENYLTISRHSAYEINMKCYEAMEALCLKPLPTVDLEKVMYLIFCRTVDLHFIPVKRNNNRQSTSSKHGESIADFFLHLLSTYFEKMQNVMTKFIKSLLSNLDHKFEREKYQKLLDVAVKYELAIYWKSNNTSSIVEYLEKLALASDHRQRANCVDFCSKMLLVDSSPEPDFLLRNGKPEIPREATIIKILFEKIYDKQDNVKLKALSALKIATVSGNDYCKKIFRVVFNSQRDSEDNPEIVQILGEEAKKFQTNLLSLLQSSPSTYIRKTCLEILANNCHNLLSDEIFIETMTSLTDDQSYLVKHQLLEMVNSLLMNNTKHKSVLNMWLEIVLNLMRDNDAKIVDAAIKMLTSIFQKIESFENSFNDLQILPWNIIRLIMDKNKRNILQNTLSSSKSDFLSQDKLRKIETHIFTSNKSEAWCILSIIAKRMKSSNPDIVVKTFIDHIDRLEDNNPSDLNDLHLILEVVHSWIPIFSNLSQTQIITKISNLLQNGKAPISLVHHFYEISIMTRMLIFNQDEITAYKQRLNENSRKCILDKLQDFANSESDEIFLCHLLLYCETNTDLPKRPDGSIITFLFDFVRKIVKEDLKVTQKKDIPRKLNCCVIVLTRFAVRDNELASEITPELANLLKKRAMHISVVKTAMQCLNDLCKKHISTVQPVFKEIIYKLHSQNEEIRLFALANIYELVMQDFIKMKGRVLLNFLACLVDKNELIQLKSQAAILSYTNDKNPNLLYTCALESIAIFNDFVQIDSFGVFPIDEIDRHNLLLNGPDKQEQRHQLYHFYVQHIHEMNEIHFMMLLKQINVLTDKLEKNKFKKCPNGTAMFKDLLFTFKLICDKRGESKLNVSKVDSSEYVDNEDSEDFPQAASAATQPSNKRGRKTKQSSVTLNDAVPIIEKMILVYPQFCKLLSEYDVNLKKETDALTQSLVLNFKSFIEYSTQDFWVRAQNCKKAPTASQKRSKKETHTSGKEDMDSDSDGSVL